MIAPPAPSTEQVKLCSLAEAVSRCVRDGDLVYPAGFTHLIPFAAAHEIIRQGRRELAVARATPDLICDQLVAAGCVRRLIFSYIGNPGFGTLRICRAAVESGAVDWEEYSHFGMITRLMAGAANLPFMPMRPAGVRDLEARNPNMRRILDPFTGDDVVVVPALRPDVAIIHVQRADASGNAQLWGIIGEQKEAAFAAKRVVVMAEEIVSEETIRADPNRTLIPGFIVNAVCHVPFAAHPSYAQGCYGRDNEAYAEWEEISGDRGRTEAYLEKWVRGVDSREEYWQKLGAATHARLAVGWRPSGVVNFGDC